jgi:tetratricopeptide (TPR) repeat protein
LSGTNHYADFFWQQVTRRVAYWRDYVTAQTNNGPALTGKQGQIMRAIHFGLRETGAWSTVLALIEAFAPYMERAGQWEAWQAILEQAMTVAHRLDDLAGVVKLSVLQARLLQRQSRFKESVAAYRRAIRLARRVGDEFSEARACSNLGYFYVEHGRWQRAEVLCCHALTIFERLDKDHGRAHTENHLGFLYARQQRWSLAHYHLEQAHTLWQRMNDQHGLMRAYINLSSFNIDRKRPDIALKYSEKARVMAHLTKEDMEFGTIYMNMSIAYRLKGEPDDAAKYLWQAETIFRRFGNLTGLAQVADNRGILHLDEKSWTEAQKWLTVALERWRNLGSDIGQLRVLGYFIEYELARGEWRKAAASLAELERILAQKENENYRSLKLRLLKYRRNQTEQSSVGLRQI